MDERQPFLSYASPQPVPRPSMVDMLIGILVSMFLLAFGFLTGGAVVMGIAIAVSRGETTGLMFAGVMFPFALLFLPTGTLVMLRTVASLCGMPPRGARWERWAEMINTPLYNDRR